MNDIQKLETMPAAIEQVLIKGDLKQLTTEQRLAYYKAVCEAVGLNPLTKPFEYIELQGKLTLYATKACAEQLRRTYAVSVVIVDRRRDEDLFTVIARATLPDGRQDESMAAIDVTGQKGERLANSLMKCETKAKRRATLSICGLGMLDETEVESIEREGDTGKDALARIIDEAAEAPKVIEAPKAAQPVPTGPFKYRIPELDERKQRWLEANGAEWDEGEMLWIAPKRLAPLDKFEVKQEVAA